MTAEVEKKLLEVMRDYHRQVIDEREMRSAVRRLMSGTPPRGGTRVEKILRELEDAFSEIAATADVRPGRVWLRKRRRDGAARNRFIGKRRDDASAS